MPEQPNPTKGNEVALVKGKYKGLRAWINIAKTQTTKMYYVVVEGKDGVEFTTRVKKTSVGKPAAEPATFEEAALQQIPEIEDAVRQAAFLFAKCGISDWSEASEACRIFCQFGEEEHVKLTEMGPRAQFFNVNWAYGNQNEEETKNDV